MEVSQCKVRSLHENGLKDDKQRDERLVRLRIVRRVFISIARRWWLGSAVGHENEVFMASTSEYLQILCRSQTFMKGDSQVAKGVPPNSQIECAGRYPIKQTPECHEALFCLIVVIVNLGCVAVTQPDFKRQTRRYDGELGCRSATFGSRR